MRDARDECVTKDISAALESFNPINCLASNPFSLFSTAVARSLSVLCFLYTNTLYLTNILLRTRLS